jgi:adenylate cyclase
LQDQITDKIVAALAVKLTAGENEKTARRGTENVAAYEEFLKGWGHYLRFTSDDLAKAIQLFKAAIALDPNYGQANAALALTYWSGSNIGMVSRGLGLPYIEARLVARKYLMEAMKNPTSIAHLVNSRYYLFRRQHEEGVSELQRALLLDPNNPSCNVLMGNALFLSGKPREAVDFINRAMRLDPHNPGRYLYLLGGAQFCIGNLEEAATLIEKGIKLNPELTGAAGWLAAAHGLLGHGKEARAALDIYNWVSPNRPRKIRNIMYFFPFKDRAVADRFAEGLARAGAPGGSSGYFRAYKENQLSGKEIESLLFGSTTTGPNRLDMDDGQYWLTDRKKNGDLTYRGPEPILVDTGKSWIEGDMVCQQYQKSWKGLEYCATVFKNPGGTYKGKNEYYFCRDFGFIPFSVVR